MLAANTVTVFVQVNPPKLACMGVFNFWKNCKMGGCVLPKIMVSAEWISCFKSINCLHISTKRVFRKKGNVSPSWKVTKEVNISNVLLLYGRGHILGSGHWPDSPQNWFLSVILRRQHDAFLSNISYYSRESIFQWIIKFVFLI